MEELNVGAVPMFKMHNVGSVPTSKMNNVEDVPIFKLYNIGTVPTFSYYSFLSEFGLYGKIYGRLLHLFNLI